MKLQFLSKVKILLRPGQISHCAPPAGTITELFPVAAFPEMNPEAVILLHSGKSMGKIQVHTSWRKQVKTGNKARLNI